MSATSASASASASVSADVDKIKMDVEASRVEVMKAEREISLIKQALRALGPGGDDEEPNSLKISVTKVTGLPDEAKPVINIQLSSPIESQTITQLSDPLNPELEGSLAHFKGVEIENATLTVDVSDADIPLGSSAVLDVKPLTEIDVMGGGGSAKVTKHNMEIAIVPGEQHSDTDANAVKVEDAGSEEEKVEEAQSAEEAADVETADSDEEFVDAKSELNDTPSSKSDEGEVEAEEEKSDDDGEVVEVEKDEQDVEAKVEVTEAKVVAAAADEESDTKAEADVTEESNAEGTKEEDKEETTETDTEVVEKSTEEEGAGDGDDKGEGDAKPEDEDTTESNETPEREKTEEKVVEEEETETPTSSTSATASALVPTCFVHSQIEFIPSAKDKKDELYVLLNKASKQKASAVDKLRKSAAALNRSRMVEAQTTRSTAGGASGTNAAVKPGFLNKKTSKKEPMFLVRWYEKTLGPNSMLRKVYPIAKNYILFFGGVALMHFQGQQLSLPPPV